LVLGKFWLENQICLYFGENEKKGPLLNFFTKSEERESEGKKKSVCNMRGGAVELPRCEEKYNVSLTRNLE